MSENSSNKPKKAKRSIQWNYVLLLPLWVVFGFGVAQLVLTGVFWLLKTIGVPFEFVDASVINSVFAAAVYLLTLTIVIGAPFWFRKRITSRNDLGTKRWPSWFDILLAPAGFILYLLITAILAYLATSFLPVYDATQVQETGFSVLSNYSEYLLAFVTLIIIAPLAEEILFRGYLYGKLRKHAPIWLSILVTSALFGVVHGQWNVGIDVFALSIVLCALREITGNIWAGVLLHMLKNGIAFYLLFINPTLLNIMSG